MKILVVGNIAGGKTVLSRRLAKIHDLPLLHVDSIQFLPGMKIRPHEETQKIIDLFLEQDNYLVDGFGPLNKIELRFCLAEVIIFVDFPLWRHFWWLVKRQVRTLVSSRAELPVDCDERTIAHTLKLAKSLFQIHRKMRPELLRIFQKKELKGKLLHIQDLRHFRKLKQDGLNKVTCFHFS